MMWFSKRDSYSGTAALLLPRDDAAAAATIVVPTVSIPATVVRPSQPPLIMPSTSTTTTSHHTSTTTSQVKSTSTHKPSSTRQGHSSSSSSSSSLSKHPSSIHSKTTETGRAESTVTASGKAKSSHLPSRTTKGISSAVTSTILPSSHAPHVSSMPGLVISSVALPGPTGVAGSSSSNTQDMPGRPTDFSMGRNDSNENAHVQGKAVGITVGFLGMASVVIALVLFYFRRRRRTKAAMASFKYTSRPGSEKNVPWPVDDEKRGPVTVENRNDKRATSQGAIGSLTRAFYTALGRPKSTAEGGEGQQEKALPQPQEQQQHQQEGTEAGGLAPPVSRPARVKTFFSTRILSHNPYGAGDGTRPALPQFRFPAVHQKEGGGFKAVLAKVHVPFKRSNEVVE